MHLVLCRLLSPIIWPPMTLSIFFVVAAAVVFIVVVGLYNVLDSVRKLLANKYSNWHEIYYQISNSIFCSGHRRERWRATTSRLHLQIQRKHNFISISILLTFRVYTCIYFKFYFICIFLTWQRYGRQKQFNQLCHHFLNFIVHYEDFFLHFCKL